jgi:hypothetical protein
MKTMNMFKKRADLSGQLAQGAKTLAAPTLHQKYSSNRYHTGTTQVPHKYQTRTK